MTVNKEWNTKLISTESGEIAEEIVDEFQNLWNCEYALPYDDFYEVDLSLKQKVVCMLVTTRNQQYFFECKQDARFLQIIDLFEQKKIRYIDRNHFISIKR